MTEQEAAVIAAARRWEAAHRIFWDQDEVTIAQEEEYQSAQDALQIAVCNLPPAVDEQ